MADETCIIDPQHACWGLQKSNMLEEQLKEYRAASRETHQEIYNRIAELEKMSSAQTAQYQSIMDKLTEMSTRLNDALATIAALKEKPGKRWESIVDKIIWAVVGAVVVFLLGKVGL